MNLEELARRITRLEDIDAIKELKARYCSICDDDHNPDRITTIFSEDGEWEGRGIGHAKGHAAIRELFVGFQKSISFSQHMVMNPHHRGERRPCEGGLVLLRPVHDARGQPGEMADRALSRRLREGERAVEDPPPSRKRSGDQRRLRNRLGEKTLITSRRLRADRPAPPSRRSTTSPVRCRRAFFRRPGTAASRCSR